MDRGIAASACGLVLVAVLCLAAAGCIRDTRDLHAASAVPELVSSHLSSRSWVLCPLLGPRTHHPGVYGTDLGFSAEDPAHPDRLALLFGDTWAKPLDACQYPVGKSDDLQAWLPRARPRGEGEDLCKSLGYELHEASDATSWSRLRLFPSRVAASDDARIDTGALRTPLAAFSDGKQLYAIVGRNDPVYCNVARDCPAAMSCTTDPAYRGKPVGMCGKSMEAAPLYCRDDHDCLPTVSCKRPARGLCVAQVPFTLQRAGGDVSPRWYYDDPRQGVANTLYVAAAVWPERPSDYAVIRRFETQRFVNVAARTVAHFDPQDASHNDYTPGHETLLLWGRPSFVTHGAAQSLPFFAYVRLDALSGEANADAKLEPQFFAGYDGAGAPRWSAHEADAQPIYGADAASVSLVAGKLAWRDPEVDYVNQMSVSWVAPLSRWVMFYGGDVPAFLVADPSTGNVPEPQHASRTPGAILMRTASQPWGRATLQRPLEEGWSSAEAVLTRRDAAPYLACGSETKQALPGCLSDGDPHGPLDLLAALAHDAIDGDEHAPDDVASRCLRGELVLGAQQVASGNRVGRLYGANILDAWTQPGSVPTAPGEHAAELYWNVSTWNPYQVILVKTLLREPRR